VEHKVPNPNSGALRRPAQPVDGRRFCVRLDASFIALVGIQATTLSKSIWGDCMRCFRPPAL